MLAANIKPNVGDLDIRPMRLGDRWAIEQLMDVLTAEGEENSAGLENMPLACHMAPTRVWIAKWFDAIVATICVTRIAHRVAGIHGLHVQKDWRETPLPLRMIITALEDGRSQGCQTVQFDPALAVMSELLLLIDARFLNEQAATMALVLGDTCLNT